MTHDDVAHAAISLMLSCVPSLSFKHDMYAIHFARPFCTFSQCGASSCVQPCAETCPRSIPLSFAVAATLSTRPVLHASRPPLPLAECRVACQPLHQRPTTQLFQSPSLVYHARLCCSSVTVVAVRNVKDPSARRRWISLNGTTAVATTPCEWSTLNSGALDDPSHCEVPHNLALPSHQSVQNHLA